MKDWQEYSLETFERDWLGPRRKPSASMGSSTSSDANALHLSFLLALSSFSRGTHQSPHSFAPAPIGVIHRPLQNVLRAEGRCWYLLGRDLGYFPDRELPEPPADNIDAEFFFTNSEKVAAERSGVLTLETFAMWLAEAREDLTVARIAFLRLLLFAPTAEWEHELEAVRRLASFFVAASVGSRLAGNGGFGFLGLERRGTRSRCRADSSVLAYGCTGSQRGVGARSGL